MSAARVRGFRNSIQGNIVEETGAFTKFDTQTGSIVMGLNVQCGGKRHAGASPIREQVEPLAQAEL